MACTAGDKIKQRGGVLSRLGRRLSRAVAFPFPFALLLGEADGDEGDGELE